MSEKAKEVVAIAVRVETNPDSGNVYLVFKIVDEGFKARIKKDWVEDVELKLIGKNLVIEE